MITPTNLSKVIHNQEAFKVDLGTDAAPLEIQLSELNPETSTKIYRLMHGVNTFSELVALGAAMVSGLTGTISGVVTLIALALLGSAAVASTAGVVAGVALGIFVVLLIGVLIKKTCFRTEHIGASAQNAIKELIAHDVTIAKKIIVAGGPILAMSNRPIDLIDEETYRQALRELRQASIFDRIAFDTRLIPARFADEVIAL